MSILGSSAVMAAGTVVSRISGYVRSALLVAALGAGLHGDVFNIANTVPNMLYILLAGGVFNAVLVPQLVRAMERHPDRGDAYTSRIITLAALFLAGVSALLVLAAPLLMRIFLDSCYFTPELAAQRDSAIDFARYCLPQVFFYGMFVLVGQVLNARGSFGPMMWAPIANNVVSIAVLAAYLGIFGHAVDVTAHPGLSPAPQNSTMGPFGTGQELLLGLGSTAGIVVQLLVLLPYLRAAGFRFQPRLDFRNSGLGHTLRLGLWTVLFVVVNQVAFTVVVRLASSGTAGSGTCGVPASSGTGYTVYSNSFLLIMAPHSVITVSLATAMLPRLSRLAAGQDLRAVGREVSATLRTTYALVVPIVALLPLVALEVAILVFGWGAARNSADSFTQTLAVFALGLFFFTTHYLMLRGFYALEQTRRVFFIQCVVGATNVVVAIVLTHGSSPAQISPRLALAYAASYAVGSVLSYAQLSRQLGGLDGRRLVRFSVRMVVATAVATGLAWLTLRGMDVALPGTGKPAVLARLLVTGAVDGAVFVALARALRISEVTEVLDLLGRRLPLPGVSRRS
ncbi:MAG TPA: murein biosynthesis integral membrane protein MurJ [Marmoricola sp.]